MATYIVNSGSQHPAFVQTELRVWANGSERMADTPAAIGQYGIQLPQGGGPYTTWRADGLNPGSWTNVNA